MITQCPACNQNVDYMYFLWLYEAGYHYMENDEEEPCHTAPELCPLPHDILNGTAPYARFCSFLNECDLRTIAFNERITIRQLLIHIYKNGPREVEPRYNYRRQMLHLTNVSQ